MILAPPLVKATVGVVTFSFVAIVNVTTSPVVASVAVELSLAILDVLIVGAVLSKVTLPLPLVTATPALPAESLKAIL